MKHFISTAAALAMLAGALGACASPHYPTREGYASGPEPLTFGKPQPKYATEESASAAASKPSQASADDAHAASAPPTPSPVAEVQSQDLPPAKPAPSSQSLAAPTNTEGSDAPPTAPPASPASDAGAPASASQPIAPPLAPRAVIHDAPTPASPTTPASPPPPAHEAMVTDTRRPAESAVTIAGRVVAASDVFENYEVQKGDHIDALARAFSTSRKVLLDANERLKPPYRLSPGQILKVPVAKAYVAERGDTLSGVARRFGVEAGELADLNHISIHAALRSGQEIGLPSSMHDRGPLRSATAPHDYAAYRPPTHPDYSSGNPPPNPGLETPLPGGRSGLTPATPTNTNPNPIHPVNPGYHTIPPSGPPQSTSTLTDAQVASAAHGRFIWPLHGDIATRFGPQGVGRRNDGVDIKAAQGAPVLAAAAGDVVYSGNLVPGYGNLVLIKHADGWVTAYAHMDKLEVHMKDHVSQGQEVGQAGMTGDATTPGVHFEVRYAPTVGAKTQPVDPVLVLPSG